MANANPRVRSVENNWSEKEESYLAKNYATQATPIIAEKLGRSPLSIRAKALKLGLVKESRFWTNEQELFLLKNYNNQSIYDLAIKLNKTEFAISNKKRELMKRLKAKIAEKKMIIRKN